MKASIIVPTYRRCQDLDRCLAALQQQRRQPDEVLVIVRDIDTETQDFLRQRSTPLPLQIVTVTIPGQVAALNAGLAAAQGDILAITDDDAAPHPHWLQTIEQHFTRDPQVGGVGGRDWLYLNGQLQDAAVHPGASDTVGKVTWFGRAIGNHHIGTGEPREVDILKGANMSYRRAAIENLRFSEALLGSGAQVHNDLEFSFAVKQRGWKLMYDPAVSVDHFLAQRFDEDQRLQFNYTAQYNAAFNEAISLLPHLPPSNRLAYVLWSLLIGSRKTLGLMQTLRFLPQEGWTAIQKFQASSQGRIAGMVAWLSSGTRSAHS
ncbi:glycosyltransferase family 2 protein [Alkalinema pantanalense CENA528]|uniref:glycosyltransferase family 2 protein n=1 Tax=Alkalinema pantanalense TaxID=1620705 RepID=UPI003D6F9D4A